MIIERFVAEAKSGRAAFRCTSLQSTADNPFLPPVISIDSIANLDAMLDDMDDKQSRKSGGSTTNTNTNTRKNKPASRSPATATTISTAPPPTNVEIRMTTPTSTANHPRTYCMDPEPEMAVSVLTTSSGGTDTVKQNQPEMDVIQPTAAAREYSYVPNKEPPDHTNRPTTTTANPYTLNNKQNNKQKQAVSSVPLKPNVIQPAVNFAPGTAVAMETPAPAASNNINDYNDNNEASTAANAYAMMQSTKNIQKITEDYSDGTKVVKTTTTHNKRDGTKIVTTEEDIYTPVSQPQQQPQYHPYQQQQQQQGCECCIVS